jgi:hypothetical protein
MQQTDRMDDFRILKMLSNTLQQAKIIENVNRKNFNAIRIVKQTFSFYSPVPKGGD